MSVQLKISQQEFDKFMEVSRILLSNYYVQECKIKRFVTSNPANTSEDVVDGKVRMLNGYYSTRVPRKTKNMVKNIVSISDIDSSLRNGNTNIVHLIAKTDKNYFSFATKFCALHEPDQYPIYDNFVWSLFIYLGKQGFFSEQTYSLFKNIKQSPGGYADYKIIYNEFIKKTGMGCYCKSYRQVDAYLWGIIKVYHICKNQDSEYQKIFSNIFSVRAEG
jgi:hypothetical protein